MNTPTALNHCQSYQLENFCAFRCEGANTIEFLQGQLTLDLNTLELNELHRTAYCAINGRVLDIFYVVKEKQDVVLLIFDDKPLAEKIVKKLANIARLSHVTIVPSEQQFMGLTGSCKKQLDYFKTVYQVGSSQWLILNNTPNKTHTNNTFNQTHWHYCSLKNGQPSIHIKTAKQFLPSELNLLVDGTVSVKKGCYIGQEIIARMYFKGKNKYQTLTLETPEPIGEPGNEIMHESRVIGHVMDTCTINQSTISYITVLERYASNYTHATLKCPV